MPDQIEISAVVPVHNEADFLAQALPELLAQLEATGLVFEVIVSENGSSDATAALAEEFAAEDGRVRVLTSPTPDYGAAMRAGFLAASGRWVVNFDIDYFSGPFVSEAIAGGADLTLASKRVPGADDRRSLFRRAGTWGFNLLLRSLFGSRVSDTHGMKVISASVVADIVDQVVSTQDLFDTELVLRAERAGYAIAELPAVVEEIRPARSSFLRRVPRTVRGLLRVRRLMGRR
jgi:glycosyltransferase involved in cell wall biosynthesis